MNNKDKWEIRIRDESNKPIAKMFDEPKELEKQMKELFKKVK